MDGCVNLQRTESDSTLPVPGLILLRCCSATKILNLINCNISQNTKRKRFDTFYTSLHLSGELVIV